MYKNFIFFFLFCISGAYAQGKKHETRSIETIRKNIAAFSQYLVAGDYDAVAAAYTPDGKIFPPNMPILSGTESLLRFWKPAPDARTRTVFHQVRPEEIWVEGKTAFDWGYYEGKMRQADGSETPWRGKYVIVWRETAPGVWKIYLDAWSRAPFEEPFAVAAAPALLPPDLINSAYPEFGAALRPDGKAFWFNRTSSDRSKMSLFETRYDKGQWAPAAMPVWADTVFSYIDPWASFDGKRLLFSSNRPASDEKPGDYNLWSFDFDTQHLQALPASVNSAADEIFCSAAKSGTLYFARFQGGKSKIFCAPYQNNTYQAAFQASIPGTDTASIINPAVSPDENYLVFASGQLGGYGSADLFVSRRQPDGKWSAPRNLGPTFNSPYADFAPAFSADGKTLFFTSERPGVVQDFPADRRRPGDLYAVSFNLAADDEKAVRAVHKAYTDAWLKGDAEGVLSLFEATARITPNGARGIDSLRHIRAFWFPDDGSVTTIHRFDNDIKSFQLDGDLAFTSQKTMLDWSYVKGETRMGRIQHGYAHTVYRRQADGGWKIWRQSWSDVASAPR